MVNARCSARGTTLMEVSTSVSGRGNTHRLIAAVVYSLAFIRGNRQGNGIMHYRSGTIY